MTCRHMPGDPNCSTRNPERMREAALADYARWVKVDNNDYTIEDVEVMSGSYLILRVKYPHCQNCAFDSNKILVFKATPLEAMKWKEIDPHFRDKPSGPRAAPSPIARFPASADGWKHAKAFVQAVLLTY